MQQKEQNTIKSLTLAEIWGIVYLFPDYEVSNLGNVRSKGRFKRWGKEIKWENDIILSPGINNGGYKYVVLRNYTTKKRYSIHELVLMMFEGPRPYKYDINHLNGIPSDNRLENLEYCTKSENCLHAYRIGLNPGKRKITNKRIGFGINP